MTLPESEAQTSEACCYVVSQILLAIHVRAWRSIPRMAFHLAALATCAAVFAERHHEQRPIVFRRPK